MLQTHGPETSKKFPKISFHEARTLEAFKKAQVNSTPGISVTTQQSPRAVHNAIKKLVSKGLLVPSNPKDNKPFYQLTKKGKTFVNLPQTFRLKLYYSQPIKKFKGKKALTLDEILDTKIAAM